MLGSCTVEIAQAAVPQQVREPKPYAVACPSDRASRRGNAARRGPDTRRHQVHAADECGGRDPPRLSAHERAEQNAVGEDSVERLSIKSADDVGGEFR